MRTRKGQRRGTRCVRAIHCSHPHPQSTHCRLPLGTLTRRISPPHNVQFTTPPTLQDGRLPYDLALEFGGSAKLLGLLQPGSAAWSEGYQQADEPLVTAAESRVFESLSRLLDPNPRRLKRIISVYALATEVAKRRPISGGFSKARYAICIPPT